MADTLSRDLLLDSIEQAYDRKSWHGPNLRGSLRGVTIEQACWRPGGNRHNIWEIMVHAAYWKYAVTRKLTGEKRGSFPLKGSNWFARPVETSEPAWRKDLGLLQAMHEALRAAVTGVPTSTLYRALPGGKSTPAYLVTGVAAHDVYHAGQIQLLKRLYAQRAT